jgi:error-prone DNA polymerase
VSKLLNRRLVRYAGLVTVRQSPETANGTTFIGLEDEKTNLRILRPIL